MGNPFTASGLRYKNTSYAYFMALEGVFKNYYVRLSG